jgi:hypothetical protein
VQGGYASLPELKNIRAPDMRNDFFYSADPHGRIRQPFSAVTHPRGPDGLPGNYYALRTWNARRWVGFLVRMSGALNIGRPASTSPNC